MINYYFQGSGQAVAIRVTADRCAFYDCRFLGWQVIFIHYLVNVIYIYPFYLANTL